MSLRTAPPAVLVVPGLLLSVDVCSRIAGRAWLPLRDIDLGALILMLRIHRSTTFFPLVPLAPIVQAIVAGALLIVLIALGLLLASIGQRQRVGALLAACGGLANGIELWCCGVSDLFEVRAFEWHSPVFNLGDANLVVGLALLLLARRPAKHGPEVT